MYNTTFAGNDWYFIVQNQLVDQYAFENNVSSKEPTRYIRERSFKDISKNVFHYALWTSESIQQWSFYLDTVVLSIRVIWFLRGKVLKRTEKTFSIIY